MLLFIGHAKCVIDNMIIRLHTQTHTHTQSDSMWFRFTEFAMCLCFVWRIENKQKKTSATNSVGTQFISFFVEIIKVFYLYGNDWMNECSVHPFALSIILFNSFEQNFPMSNSINFNSTKWRHFRPFLAIHTKFLLPPSICRRLVPLRRKLEKFTYKQKCNCTTTLGTSTLSNLDDIKHAQTIHTENNSIKQ